MLSGSQKVINGVNSIIQYQVIVHEEFMVVEVQSRRVDLPGRPFGWVWQAVDMLVLIDEIDLGKPGLLGFAQVVVADGDGKFGVDLLEVANSFLQHIEGMLVKGSNGPAGDWLRKFAA